MSQWSTSRRQIRTCSLVGRVTVLIKREGTSIPFNINGLSTIEYPRQLGQEEQAEQEILGEARQAIAKFIRNGLETLETDSLVCANLPTWSMISWRR